MFEIILYQNTGENNRVDKTDYITEIAKINGTLKTGTSIVNPTIMIESTNYRYNYVYIKSFNRYYFVVDTRIIRNNLVELSLKCDVLMSYKNDILASRLLVARNEYLNTTSYEDDRILTYYRKNISEIKPTNLSSIPITYFSNIQNTSGLGSVIINYINTDPPTYLGSSVDINSYNLVNPNITAQKQLQFGGLQSSYTTVVIDVGQLRKLVTWLQDKGRSSYIISIIVLPYYVNVNTEFGFEFTINGESSGIRVNYPRCFFGEYINIANFKMSDYRSFSPVDNFLNYEPYSSYELYLPFHSWITLNYSLVKDSEILVQYVVNYIDGSAQVSVIDTKNQHLIYQNSCQLGIRIGVSSTNSYDISILKAQNIIGGTLGALSSVFGIGSSAVGLSSGLALSDFGMEFGLNSAVVSGTNQANQGLNGIVSNSFNLVGGIANTILKDKSLYATAKAQASGGLLSLYTPQDCRLRRNSVVIGLYDTDFAHQYGKPLNEYQILNNLKGFTTIASSNNIKTFLGATTPEITEIKTLLVNGVYLKQEDETEETQVNNISEV